METGRNDSDARRVLLGTVHGVIEGSIALGQQVRTLDFLNRGATRFLPLHAARAWNPSMPLEGGSVCVNMSTILWVAEVEATRRSGSFRVKPQLNRCAVRFSFANYEVLGFLHAPVQGDPFARLNQDRGAFVALTSASVTGQDTEMAAEFLAVNSHHVYTAEVMAHDDAALEGASMFEEAGS